MEPYRGWASYYRSVVSKEVFAQLDHHLWRVTYKWALRAHPNKSKTWVVNQYFGRFNQSRNDRWIFGDRDSGAYLVRFVWTKIVRHQMVTGTASPDDLALSDYWAKRRSRKPLPLDKLTLGLARKQRGLCPLCQERLLHADAQPNSPQIWEAWQAATRRAIRKIPASDAGPRDVKDDALQLVHTHCHQRRARRRGRKTSTPAKPAGLA